MTAATLEHRCGRRLKISGLIALAISESAGPVALRVRDASVSGMFLEVAGSGLRPHTKVMIQATLPGPHALRTYSWPAMVVRVTQTGIGVVFDDLNTEAIAEIMALFGGGGVAGSKRVTGAGFSSSTLSG